MVAGGLPFHGKPILPIETDGMPVELLTLDDGRALAFERFGDLAGDPVYFFHGFPGSRLQAALVAEQAKASGICLIAFDRPGFGQSTRQPARTICGIAEDVSCGMVDFGRFD